MNSNVGSECDDDDQLIEERKEEIGFEELLHKSMNIQALKKTKSSTNDKISVNQGMIMINQTKGKEIRFK